MGRVNIIGDPQSKDPLRLRSRQRTSPSVKVAGFGSNVTLDGA